MNIPTLECFIVSHVLVHIIFIAVFFMNDISDPVLFFTIVEIGALALSVITSTSEMMKGEHSAFNRGDF